MNQLIVLSPEDRMLLNELRNELRYRYSKDQLPPVLISYKEAARLLKKSPMTISNYVRQKRITPRTIDGVTGILLSDIIDRLNPS